MKFGIGQAVTRFEDQRLLTGAGRYTDDLPSPGAARMVVLRSPHAHAAIRAIDTGEAAAAPGMLLVATAADLAADEVGDIPCLIPVRNQDGSPMHESPWPVLARERVRHVGEAVALVVAETLDQALDAVELVEVDYEPLEAVADPESAQAEAAPLVRDMVPGNRVFDWRYGDAQAVDEVFAQAARTVSVELVNNRVIANSLEPRCSLAEYDPQRDRVTLYSSTQGPDFLHGVLAERVLNCGKERLRCVTTDVGGGFGMKLFVYPEHALIAWAARKLRRALRYTPERSEAMQSDVHGRDHRTRAEAALDGTGRILAVRVHTRANMGAYLSNYGPFIPTDCGAPMLTGCYAIPALHYRVEGLLTHTVPVDAYRGAGRPEAIYVIERLVDAAARETGLGPVEFRRRNFVTPAQMPYRNAYGCVYDSGEFEALMDRALEEADWAGFDQRRAEAKSRGRLRGLGLAMYIERCGGGAPLPARVAFNDDDTDRRVDLFELARVARDPENLPEGETAGLDSEGSFRPPEATYPNGCHICEVEISPDTGKVWVAHYTVIDDFGAVINPLLLAGQIHGGITQGIGQALYEQACYDSDGQLLSATFQDYCMPRADNLPSFRLGLRNVPCTTNPLGIKGAGEAGTVGAPPAVVNACVDALHPATGITHVDMPVTPEKVWRLLARRAAA